VYTEQEENGLFLLNYNFQKTVCVRTRKRKSPFLAKTWFTEGEVYTEQEENDLFLLNYNFSENGMCQDSKKKITFFD
jgi:hypothetical protein